MFARIIVLTAAVGLVFASTAQADEVGGGPIVVPPTAVVEEVIIVTAAPPPFVSLKTTSVGAGLGLSWGAGTLSFEGERHDFRVKGFSVGELGIAKLSGEGDVTNLAHLSDFEGTYMAVEAGASAGVGGSAVSMRNEHGVVIMVRSQSEGVNLKLGAEGLSIALD